MTTDAERTTAAESSGRAERRVFFTILAGIALVLGVLALPILSRKVFTYDDMTLLCLPLRYCYAKALAAGDSVLWAPQLNNGFYLHGDGQAGMFHPLHWLLYRALPLDVAFNLEFLWSYVLVLVGFFFMARRFGIERVGALYGAALFAFSGFNLFHFMHVHAVAVVAHIPWLILCIDLLLRATSRRVLAGAWLGVALLTASQLLVGYPQYVVFSGMAEVAYFAWAFRSRASAGRAPLFVGAKLCGVLVGAVQILATWETLGLSQRSGSSADFRTWFSLHPLNLIQLWSPFVLRDRYYADVRATNGNPHELGLYAGAFCTVALAWLFIRRRQAGGQGRFVAALVAFAGAMLVLALGKYGGVQSLIVRLPLYSSLPLRCPARHIVLVHLALAILASIALSDLVRSVRLRERLPWRALWPLAVPVALSALTSLAAIAILLLHPVPAWSKELGTTLSLWKSVLVIAAAAGFTAAAARGARWGVYAIVVLTFLEIGAWGVWKQVWRPGPPRTLSAIVAALSPTPPPVTEYPRLSFPEITHSGPLVLAGYGLREAYVALIPAQWIAPSLPAFRVAGVDAVLAKDGWRPVPSPMPRARLVGTVVQRNAASADFDVTTTAVVEVPLQLDGEAPGQVTMLLDRPGHLEVATHAPSRQLLVLTESFHPGWRATADGRPVPTLRAYGSLLACAVDPGVRQVVFRFTPWSFSWGSRLSLCGLGLAIAGFAALFLRGPRK